MSPTKLNHCSQAKTDFLCKSKICVHIAQCTDRARCYMPSLKIWECLWTKPIRFLIDILCHIQDWSWDWSRDLLCLLLDSDVNDLVLTQSRALMTRGLGKRPSRDRQNVAYIMKIKYFCQFIILVMFIESKILMKKKMHIETRTWTRMLWTWTWMLRTWSWIQTQMLPTQTWSWGVRTGSWSWLLEKVDSTTTQTLYDPYHLFLWGSHSSGYFFLEFSLIRFLANHSAVRHSLNQSLTIL